MNLYHKNFLTLRDYTPEEITFLIDLASSLKKKKKQGIRGHLLDGKNIVIIFEKTSTRTRCSFEVGAYDEGANVTYLTNSQMGKKESIEDTAKVLGRFYDGIAFRGFSQETVQSLADFSGVPVWNGLTDLYHPTQILADMLTIRENFGELKGKKLVFVGDARNNMGNSLMIGCAKLGMDFVALAPQELFPSEELTSEMKEVVKQTGGSISLTSDIAEAVDGADVIYTDVWVSMGEEDKTEERIKLLKDFQVNEKMIQLTHNPDVIFLHCLPSFHDLNTKVAQDIYKKYGLKEMEVTDSVFRASYSKVFDEAENRMHAIKAIMVATLVDNDKLNK
ncbi:ornithine carbamoyltransferase [Pseudoramibacter sp.]|jgi:ornithine carbamoyltransferase|uniref:ornithine carbamoyltransferase n=1 Tax=Pseudoramibacter sp. TaxID=2034862 RepID=UPI0025E1CD27|nr:ornithine carbamoyltransferase [Pseudoramibacter sp.]MCH4072937.1 ornithine carbamoyltransferase [Pseudoramibacter sp.]MCH4106708.1 ornithine carbamoyltransferase [Pseudoramibacter sp.]